MYQYQHLYNLAQKRMRDYQTEFCWYVGLASLKQEARKLGLGADIRREILMPIMEVGGSFMLCHRFCVER